MENLNQVVLEPSTNTHLIKGKVVDVQNLEGGVMKLHIQGDGVVVHGEHGTLKTESEHIIKYVQQELNPVTNAMQAAFD